MPEPIGLLRTLVTCAEGEAEVIEKLINLTGQLIEDRKQWDPEHGDADHSWMIQAQEIIHRTRRISTEARAYLAVIGRPLDD